MAGKHHEGRRAGCCDQADGSAEEIWTASTGSLLPARPSSRANRDVAGLLRGLRWEVAAITDALAGDTSIPVV